MRTKNKFPLRDIIKRRRRDEQSERLTAAAAGMLANYQLSLMCQDRHSFWCTAEREREKTLCTLGIALAVHTTSPEEASSVFSIQATQSESLIWDAEAFLLVCFTPLANYLFLSHCLGIVPFNFPLICQSYQNVNYRPSKQKVSFATLWWMHDSSLTRLDLTATSSAAAEQMSPSKSWLLVPETKQMAICWLVLSAAAILEYTQAILYLFILSGGSVDFKSCTRRCDDGVSIDSLCANAVVGTTTQSQSLCSM